MESKELKALIEEKKSNTIEAINAMNEAFHNLNTKLYNVMNNNKMLLDEGININNGLKMLVFIPHESTEFIVQHGRNAIRVNLTETMSVSYDGKVITFANGDNGVFVMIDTNKVKFTTEPENQVFSSVAHNELTLSQLHYIDDILIHLASAYLIIKDVIGGYDELVETAIKTLWDFHFKSLYD